jgi:hypothetical protein
MGPDEDPVPFFYSALESELAFDEESRCGLKVSCFPEKFWV